MSGYGTLSCSDRRFHDAENHFVYEANASSDSGSFSALSAPGIHFVYEALFLAHNAFDGACLRRAR